MPDNGGYVDPQRFRRELAAAGYELPRARHLAEAEMSGRVIELHPDPPRPLHEYGLGPDTEMLRRRADELAEQLDDLEAHLREAGEAHDRIRELLAGMREGLQ